MGEQQRFAAHAGSGQRRLGAGVAATDDDYVKSLGVKHGQMCIRDSLVDHVIPHVPVRQWVLSLPIPLRVLLAAQPELVTPVLQVVQRVVTRHLLRQAGLKADEGHGGAVTLIQRFGSAANLNIRLHCLVLDGVYCCDADGSPAFIEADAPTDDELHALLQTVIARLMKICLLYTSRCV